MGWWVGGRKAMEISAVCRRGEADVDLPHLPAPWNTTLQVHQACDRIDAEVHVPGDRAANA
jgi:hypothetical protein